MTIAIPVGVKVALAGEVTVPVELHMEYAHYFDFFGCVTSSLAKVSH